MKKRILLSVIGSLFLVGFFQLLPNTDKNGHILDENESKKVLSVENSDADEAETNERDDETADIQIKPTEDISQNTIIETESHLTQNENTVNRSSPDRKTEKDTAEIKEKQDQKISEDALVSSEIVAENCSVPSNNQDKVDNEEKNKDDTPDEKNEEQIYEYDVGNIGKLYDTEEEAYSAAEACFNDFSDPDRYVSSYFLYSTYDKWSFNLYYSYY